MQTRSTGKNIFGSGCRKYEKAWSPYVYKRDHMAKLTILGVISIPKWYPLKMRGKQNAYEGIKSKTIIKD